MHVTAIEVLAIIAGTVLVILAGGLMVISLLPSPVTRDLYKRYFQRGRQR